MNAYNRSTRRNISAGCAIKWVILRKLLPGVSVSFFQDSIADADFDPSKHQVSDSCSDNENEYGKPTCTQSVPTSDDSDHSDVIETVPNMQKFLSTPPSTDDSAVGSFDTCSTAFVQTKDPKNNDLHPADNGQNTCNIQVPLTNNK